MIQNGLDSSSAPSHSYAH